MSYNRNKGRGLGVVRTTMSSMESVPKFPPIAPPLRHSLEDGIHGNAMAVPPPRQSPERMVRQEPRKPQPLVTPRRSLMSSKSEPPTLTKQEKAENRELQEYIVRESQLKEQISALQALLQELQEQIRQKELLITSLQEQLQKLQEQEELYKEKYEKEFQQHEKTRNDLNTTKTTLAEKVQLMEQQQREHEKSIQELNQKMETQIAEVEEEKKREVAACEEKLKRLKSQMAEALKGNSWERQQQLDELTKELTRVSEEADALRHKIKTLQRDSSKTQQSSCANCSTMTAKLTKTEKAIAERDKMIRDLKVLCQRFEKQLGQSEELRQLTKRK